MSCLDFCALVGVVSLLFAQPGVAQVARYGEPLILETGQELTGQGGSDIGPPPSAGITSDISQLDGLLSGQRTDLPGCLHLQDVIQAALHANPALAVARSRIEAALGTWTQVGLKPNPIFGYTGQEIGNLGTAGLQGFYLQKKIVRGNKLGLNRAVASHEVENARIQLTVVEQRIINDITVAYYRALVAQQQLEAVRQLVKVAKANVSVTDKLLVAGEVPKTNLLQAQTEEQVIRTNVIRVEANHRAALRQLVTLMGSQHTEQFSVCGDAFDALPAYDWDETQSRLLTLSPLLAAQQTRIHKSRSAIARAEAGQVPDLQVQAAVQFDDTTNSTVANFQIGRPLMIHDWNQGNLHKSKAELAAAIQQLEVIRLRLTSRLADKYRQFEASSQTARQYRDHILPIAQKNLELVRSGFAAGETNYVDLLNAQRSYFQSYSQLLDGLNAAWQAHAEITGLLLRGSLDTE